MAEARSLFERVGVLRPLRIRDFRLLWTGMTVSLIGDGVYIVAVAWLVYQELGASPAALAAVGVAWTTPQVVFVLASGALSDRMDRRWLMIAGDLIRLMAIGTIGVLALTAHMTVPILVGLIVPYGIGQAMFSPAFSSFVPLLVPEDQLVEANSIGQVVRPLAMMVIGPTLGGLLVAPGAGWAFVADAATFAVSAGCIFAMRTRPEGRPKEGRNALRHDVAEGIRYVRSETWIWAALVAATISLLCTWGPWETLVPYVVKNDLDGNGLALGAVFGAGGAASVLVGLTMAQRGGLPRKPITALYLAWALGMLMTAGFGLVTSLWQAMAVAFVAEGSIALLIVIWYTLLQQLVPRELLGRVISLDWMISIAGVPISFAIVGPLAASIGVDRTLIYAGVLGCAATIAFMLVPGARGPERDGRLT
jgi:predicted outer membrane lipoprotein